MRTASIPCVVRSLAPTLSLLKFPQVRERLVIFPGRSYRHRHGGDSLRPRFDLRLPLSWPRLAGNRANRPATSGDRPAATASRSTSAFIPRPPAVGVALPDLAASHRRDDIGQAGNRDPMASQGVPAPLALAITPSGTPKNRNRDP